MGRKRRWERANKRKEIKYKKKKKKRKGLNRRRSKMDMTEGELNEKKIKEKIFCWCSPDVCMGWNVMLDKGAF